MRRRREWFHKMDVYTTLWWVPSGHRPTTDEAMAKLAHLREHGPTADAFTFRHPFPPPGSGEIVETDGTKRSSARRRLPERERK
jgi:hypothetical protein